MSMWGANPDELLAVAQRFDSAEDEILQAGTTADSAVQEVDWIGPDRDAYVEAWAGTKGGIDDLASIQRGIAEFLAMQAAQQEVASTPGGAADLSRYGDLVGGGNVLIDIVDWFSQIDQGTTDPGESWFGEDGVGPGGFRPEDIDTSIAGIQAEVADQGSHNDCWFIAGAMALASTDPGAIADAIEPLGSPPGSDGWRVDLYLEGEWHEVTVEPGDIGNLGVMNDTNGTTADGLRPGVFSILEAAMMEGVEYSSPDIALDSPDAGVTAILGPDASFSTSGNIGGHPPASEIQAAIDDGRTVTVVTNAANSNPDLVGWHVYEVVGADGDSVHLRNPHGPNSANEFEFSVPLDDNGLWEMSILDAPEAHDGSVLAPGPFDGTPSGAPSSSHEIPA